MIYRGLISLITDGLAIGLNNMKLFKIFHNGDQVPSWLNLVTVDGKKDQSALKFGALCMVTKFAGVFFVYRIYGPHTFVCSSPGVVSIIGQGKYVVQCDNIVYCMKCMYNLRRGLSK